MTINNNNIFGAFTLGEVRSGRLTGDWLNKESVANYGWFGGGSTPAFVSTVDRIDFSNDLVTPSTRGSLSATRYFAGATSNSNYGWFGGGRTTPSTIGMLSLVDRIDFSNDLSSTSPRGPLSLTKFGTSATGNSNYGWFGGGSFITPTPAIPTISTVDRIDFSNDNAAVSVRSPLSAARGYASATGNSNCGWFAGGRGGSPEATLSLVDRIDFSNDLSSTSPRGPLRLSRYRPEATGNSNYGWFGGGGDVIGGRSYLSSVDRIDFANDSFTASVRGPLSQPKIGAAAAGNSNYGWWSGGYLPSGVPGRTSVVNRIDFSNDTGTASVRAPSSPAPSARSGNSATSGVLNIRRQKAGNYGWFGGGYPATGAAGSVSTVDRIDFSNDSVMASIRGSLNYPAGTNSQTATGNSNYGWFAGGEVNRIDFSNDNATASPRGPLSAGRYTFAATGNSNYGWFGGGNSFSTVDRINFSNDSATALVRGSLRVVRYKLAATGNSNYGYFGGGTTAGPSLSTVDRIDFSNDGVQASPRGRLSSPKFSMSATGNSNYGWFSSGGFSPYPAIVDRIDFSNDSATALVRGSLSVERIEREATGNSNYGWFAGGGSPETDIVDRINFSNDNITSSVRGPLSSVRRLMAATSNTSR